MTWYPSRASGIDLVAATTADVNERCGRRRQVSTQVRADHVEPDLAADRVAVPADEPVRERRPRIGGPTGRRRADRASAG